ncbi:hypothetical protein B0A48_17990 [Cryoendolithus antarcticus]|uniref:3',5'-cyclic-nucleotide phosphodiesterase n=1 Tax=Cryoendolithus antarcticus TaxID=1507870 RepID=A0A1V8SAD0_9PEZI|nr:hypothetical protein B0A48_17990 [Cryoendolithus antarcticus]
MSDDGDGRNTSAPAVGGGPVTAHIYGHGAENPPRESRSRKRKPALQVICLGESGGPSEENVTAFLVRSLGTGWAKGGLLALDAGSHLAPITRIMERDFPLAKRKVQDEGVGNGFQTPGLSGSFSRTSLSPERQRVPDGYPEVDSDEEAKPEPTIMSDGPFAGLKVPHASARANALYILQAHVSAYLITHPHMDHMAGFTINTAAFQATSKPKTLAALPNTVDAMKRHIFNDIIWPNLTDEDGGVGFVTFQRLKEGGDTMLGEGEGRGYIDVCGGLCAKAFKVSHGTCTKGPPAHQHRGSITSLSDPHSGAMPLDQASGILMSRSLSMTQHSQVSAPGTPGRQQSFYQSPRMTAQDSTCVVDSTAYFLRDAETAREMLFFGDVEPDSISLTPRNHVVWAEAARKIASGCLTGIFIECSYDDSQADAYLFGHLAPRHLIAELQVLAQMTREAKFARATELQNVKKRKRSGPNGVETVARHAIGGETERKRSRSLASRRVDGNYRRRSEHDNGMHDSVAATSPPSPVDHMDAPGNGHDTPMSPLSHPHPQPTPHSNRRDAHPHFVPNGLSRASTSLSEPGQDDLPLAGLTVIITHIKDTFRDGPHVRELVLAEILAHEEFLKERGEGLGCEFVVARSGESYWL